MESKVFVDIDLKGNPQIRINYNHTGDMSDVRDKLLARFLFDVMYGQTPAPKMDVVLEQGHVSAEGGVFFIRLKEEAEPEKAAAISQ